MVILSIVDLDVLLTQLRKEKKTHLLHNEIVRVNFCLCRSRRLLSPNSPARAAATLFHLFISKIESVTFTCRSSYFLYTHRQVLRFITSDRTIEYYFVFVTYSCDRKIRCLIYDDIPIRVS